MEAEERSQLDDDGRSTPLTCLFSIVLAGSDWRRLSSSRCCYMLPSGSLCHPAHCALAAAYRVASTDQEIQGNRLEPVASRVSLAHT